MHRENMRLHENGSVLAFLEGGERRCFADSLRAFSTLRVWRVLFTLCALLGLFALFVLFVLFVLLVLWF